MLEIGLNTKELDRLNREVSLIDRFALTYAKRTLKAVSMAVEKRIKREMPVDTGRARASWGHGGRQEGDSVWMEGDGGLTITQGSNVPYIEYLNAGSSRQAAAGFIERADLAGQIQLEDLLGIDLLGDPNLRLLQFA